MIAAIMTILIAIGIIALIGFFANMFMDSDFDNNYDAKHDKGDVK